MKTILLSTILLMTSALAQDDCSDPRHTLLPEFEELHRYLNWNGATNQEVINAPCKTATAPGRNELLNLIAALPAGSKEDYIHGVNFSGENPALLQAFRRLTTSRNIFGDREAPSAQVNIQGEYQVNPSCTKVLCAVEKIWGPQMGPKILYAYMQFGVSTSELSNEVATRYTSEELDDILLALSDVPATLRAWPRSFQPLVHYERGALPAFHSDPRTAADSNVTLYDGWSSKSRISRQYVVFHEIGHNFARALGKLDRSSEWLQIGGWEKRGENWVSTNNCGVSNYGQTDPDEDFAEAATTYRYNGKGLRDRCPAKYQYMKDVVFQGREYLDRNCGS